MSTRMPLRLRCWPTPSGAGGRTMLGSDYSQAMGDLAECVADVEALDISAGDKKMIFGGTAQKLLGFDSA